MVNPSNPPSVMLAPATLGRIAEIVATTNPDLIIVTDDVYGTFVPGFRSLLDVVPANTIAIYSFSKYFGATGWRLGIVALYRDNVIDRQIAELPPGRLAELDRRYECISTATDEIGFIDRMVADSRQVALNHTAGLSLPQQVQMALFAIFALLDTDQSYRRCTRAIVTRRLAKLYEGLGVVLPLDTLRAGYYAEIDLARWARHRARRRVRDVVGRARTIRSTSWCGSPTTRASCCSPAAGSTARSGRCGSRSRTSTTSAISPSATPSRGRSTTTWRSGEPGV